MAQHYRFFGSADGDPREYSQTQFAEVLERILRNGYFKGVGTELQVVASTPNAMSVDVGIGQAWINGYWYGNDAVITLPIATANTVNPRIDRIVLRLDVVTNRTIELAILQGTPAVSPVAPTLTRDGQIYEIALADVLVGANVASILTANITDQRNNDTLCGFAVARNTIESGSNANGSWIKYPDGTMICYIRTSSSDTDTWSSPRLFNNFGTYNFPMSFYSLPAIIVTCETNATAGPGRALIPHYSTPTESLVNNVSLEFKSQQSASWQVRPIIVAIGRWK